MPGFYGNCTFAFIAFASVLASTNTNHPKAAIPSYPYSSEHQTMKIGAKLPALQTKLTNLIKKSSEELSSFDCKTAEDYITAMRFAEMHLMTHKKTINFYVQKISAITATCINKNFHKETQIHAVEDLSFNALGKIIEEYRKLAQNYTTLTEKFQNDKNAKNRITSSLTKATKDYLLISAKSYVDPDQVLTEQTKQSLYAYR